MPALFSLLMTIMGPSLKCWFVTFCSAGPIDAKFNIVEWTRAAAAKQPPNELLIKVCKGSRAGL